MFREDLQQLFSLPGDGTDGWRKKSWDRFLELGFPTEKMEPFQYVPLSKLSKAPLALAVSRKADSAPEILPECNESFLVFVDGFFQPQLSKIPAGVIALPLASAMKSYGLFLQNRMNRTLKEELDPLAALNGAFQGAGLFLYIPPKTALAQPIQIAHLFTTAALASPRIQLFVGEGVEASFIQTIDSIDDAPFCNAAFDCVLDGAARVSWTDLLTPLPDGIHFQALRATLKRDSRLETLHLTTGARTVRQSFKVQLAEENSEAILRGVSLLEGAAESHVHGTVEHAAPFCRSQQHFKSVLRGESRSSFEGKIYVHPIAQKTESYQKAQTLLLSDRAVSNVKPNLEIFADDVKASHGATVAQPDAEELFYLRSRGLSEPEAKALAVRGFCSDLLEQLRLPTLRARWLA